MDKINELTLGFRDEYLKPANEYCLNTNCNLQLRQNEN